MKNKVPVPMMPIEYVGSIKSGCGYTKSLPRKWTEKEVEWVLKLRDLGYNVSDIAKSTDRTEVSISVKLKRYGKTNGTYNTKHVQEKHQCNFDFYKHIMPISVLDLYCGEYSWWKNNTNATVITNDKNKGIPADYHEDAEMLIHSLYYQKCNFDLIDIDPYGSGYECFDLAIKMAKKAIVITFGEYGHKRFKRLDFVSTHYNINTIEDFTIGSIIKSVIEIGLRNKKQLVPHLTKEWDRIFRVYFEIKPLKITSQWEGKAI